MVEVFKTDVSRRSDAGLIVYHLHITFADYIANFDLEDCDRVLRVESCNFVNAPGVIGLLNKYGFFGEVLSDEVPGCITLPIK